MKKASGPNAVLLLVTTGGLLGAMFPLGKLAAEAGIPPTSWAAGVALGSGLLLLVAALGRQVRPALDRRHRRYFAVAALVSFVAPNLLAFAAIPRIGAGFTSVIYTLSPVLTLAIAALVRLRRPDALGVLGIAIGLAGALAIVLSRGEVGRPADPLWIGLALLIPTFLALGNIYRTLDWPEGTPPLALSAGSNLAAAAMLVAAASALDGWAGARALATSPGLLALQVAASAGMMGVYFRLQAVGGPVYLSQIGYVGAAVGLLSGSVMGERYPAATWVGGAVVLAGIALVTVSQARRSPAGGSPA